MINIKKATRIFSAYFFKNKSNAVIAEHYSVNSFSDNFNWVINNRERLDIIKDKAHDTGLEYFDIKSYSAEMKSFLIKVEE